MRATGTHDDLVARTIDLLLVGALFVGQALFALAMR